MVSILSKILKSYPMANIFIFVDKCLKKLYYSKKIAGDYWVVGTERISNFNEASG